MTPTEIAERIRDAMEVSGAEPAGNAHRYLGEALDAVADGMPADFVAMALYAALGAAAEA